MKLAVEFYDAWLGWGIDQGVKALKDAGFDAIDMSYYHDAGEFFLDEHYREKALEVKYQRMVELLGNQSTFYVDEVQSIFPDMKKSSLYWNMSKLVDEGYLRRIRNGVYAFKEWKGKKNIS